MSVHNYLLFLFILFLFERALGDFCVEWIKVESGGSCWQIATSRKTTVDNLLKLNPGLNCDALWVGQQICVATSSSKPTCTRSYLVASGDYCYKIWTDNGLSEKQLIDMNDGLDCNKLNVGQEICVSVDPRFSTTAVPTTTTFTISTTFVPSTTVAPSTPSTSNTTTDDHPPLPLIEQEQSCYEFVTIEEGNTCYDISVAYGLNLTSVEKEFDCENLKIGDTMCVNRDYTCQLRYSIEKGDTCFSIGKVFKLNSTEIEIMNDGLKCENLPEKRRICVWPVEERTLANLTCKTKSVVEGDSSCHQISSAHYLTIDEFRFINPTINCDEKVQKGATVCVFGQNSRKCSSIRAVPSNMTCSELAQSFEMGHFLLMGLNPTLKCEKLRETEQVCVGTGQFKPSECTESLRVTPEFSTCKHILESSGLTLDQLRTLNPNISCDSNLTVGTLVCIAWLGMETRAAQEIVISNLKSLVPELGSNFEKFLRNPNDENAVVMNQLMTRALQKPAVNSRIKEMYRIDENFRKIIDSQHPLPRKAYCDQAKRTTTTETIEACYCGNEELLIYCQALAVQKFEENEARALQNETFHSRLAEVTRQQTVFGFRRKRSIGCSFITPKSGEGILDMMTSAGSTCWGGDCSIPFGIVEIGMSAKVCPGD